MTRLIYIVFILLCFTQCKKKKTVNQTEEDEKKITQYIADNKLEAKATGSGLYYVIKTQGTGKQPDANSNVRVLYKGYLIDGTVFDKSGTNGYVTNLQEVIKGWTEGI